MKIDSNFSFIFVWIFYLTESVYEAPLGILMCKFKCCGIGACCQIFYSSEKLLCHVEKASNRNCQALICKQIICDPKYRSEEVLKSQQENRRCPCLTLLPSGKCPPNFTQTTDAGASKRSIKRGNKILPANVKDMICQPQSIEIPMEFDPESVHQKCSLVDNVLGIKRPSVRGRRLMSNGGWGKSLIETIIESESNSDRQRSSERQTNSARQRNSERQRSSGSLRHGERQRNNERQRHGERQINNERQRSSGRQRNSGRLRSSGRQINSKRPRRGRQRNSARQRRSSMRQRNSERQRSNDRQRNSERQRNGERQSNSERQGRSIGRHRRSSRRQRKSDKQKSSEIQKRNSRRHRRSSGRHRKSSEVQKRSSERQRRSSERQRRSSEVQRSIDRGRSNRRTKGELTRVTGASSSRDFSQSGTGSQWFGVKFSPESWHSNQSTVSVLQLFLCRAWFIDMKVQLMKNMYCNGFALTLSNGMLIVTSRCPSSRHQGKHVEVEMKNSNIFVIVIRRKHAELVLLDMVERRILVKCESFRMQSTSKFVVQLNERFPVNVQFERLNKEDLCL